MWDRVALMAGKIMMGVDFQGGFRFRPRKSATEVLKAIRIAGGQCKGRNIVWNPITGSVPDAWYVRAD